MFKTNKTLHFLQHQISISNVILLLLCTLLDQIRLVFYPRMFILATMRKTCAGMYEAGNILLVNLCAYLYGCFDGWQKTSTRNYITRSTCIQDNGTVTTESKQKRKRGGLKRRKRLLLWQRKEKRRENIETHRSSLASTKPQSMDYGSFLSKGLYSRNKFLFEGETCNDGSILMQKSDCGE